MTPRPPPSLRSLAGACTLSTVLAVALLAAPPAAASQRYEPLAASVRTALAAAVADDGVPAEARFDSPLERASWLAAMSERLPRKWKPEYRQRVDFLSTVHYEAHRAGLDPHLVLGLIEVESWFRRHAVSHAGARGYMQVMPFWTQVIGNGDPGMLFDLRANIRYGCTILRHYLDLERGDLFRALGRYNGSLGRAEYPNLVLRAWQKWEGAWQAEQARRTAAGRVADAGAGAAPPPAATAAPSASARAVPASLPLAAPAANRYN